MVVHQATRSRIRRSEVQYTSSFPVAAGALLCPVRVIGHLGWDSSERDREELLLIGMKWSSVPPGQSWVSLDRRIYFCLQASMAGHAIADIGQITLRMELPYFLSEWKEASDFSMLSYLYYYSIGSFNISIHLARTYLHGCTWTESLLMYNLIPSLLFCLLLNVAFQL